MPSTVYESDRSSDIFILPSDMPHWSAEDTKYALLASLIPGGTALAGAAIYMTDKGSVDWWEKLRKPKWITPNIVKVSSVVDVLSVAPVGYASYLCYKNGGGFDYNDTRLALALYGANIALVGTCIPLVKKKNLNCLSRNMVLVHGTALAAAVAFFKIHKPAGYWMVPYALWTGFYLFMVHSIKKENDPVKDI